MVEVSRDELEALVDEKVEEKIGPVVERLEEVEQENEQLRDDLQEEREQRQRLEERLDRAERANRALAAHARRLYENVDEEVERIDTNIEGVHARISGVQQSSEETEEGPHEEADALLPIEQLAQWPESVADRELDNETRRNLYRARFIWKDWNDYARKTPKGYVITSGELQRVLRAADDSGTRIESNTAKRVMDRIVEYSRGIVEKKKHNGEWIVVLPRDWREHVDELEEAPPDDVVSEVG